MASVFSMAWDSVLITPGAVRNPEVSGWIRHSLGGQHGFVTAHHPLHAALKRPQTISSMSSGAGANSSLELEVLPVVRLFNASGFHFGKVASKEIVCMFGEGANASGDTIRAISAEESMTPLELVLRGEPSLHHDSNHAREHPIFINASPFGVGHSLFVPHLLEWRAQVMRGDALALACRAARLLCSQQQPQQGGHKDTRMGFNSLGAFASVNHCHVHVWRNSQLWPGRETMPIEGARRSVVWTTSTDDAPLGVISTGNAGSPSGHNDTGTDTTRDSIDAAGQAQDSKRAGAPAVTLTLSSVHWPVPCLLLTATTAATTATDPDTGTGAGKRKDDIDRVVEGATAVVQRMLAHMLEANLPHHLVVWWETQPQVEEAQVLQVMVIPRTQQRPTAMPTPHGPSPDLSISVALLEVCGLAAVLKLGEGTPSPPSSPAYYSAEQAMHALTEGQFEAVLAQFAVSEAQLEALVRSATV